MDRIYLNELLFYGYHGVFPEEQKLGQRYIVDVVMALDLKKAGQTDELDYTIDYGDAYKRIQSIVEGKPFKLIEVVAEKIAEELLQSYSILHECTVKVTKPNPPIDGQYKSVAVEVTRGTNETYSIHCIRL
ncbi:dihydroneopterin aldolase [Bacillus sp. JCM 19034]|uniref:dihydroneopterin aldolase n=1 Tax=Bacillus sp. JCM 19034 TaxID=1481928 RepID=UPI0007852AEC|nr:dihydroneopterin aldolase [Bacillus sp. JCM 19034]